MASFTPISLEAAIATMEKVLARIYLKAQPVTADTRLEDLGLQSLDLAEVFAALETVAGAELDPVSAGDLVQVRDLVKLRPTRRGHSA